MIFTASFMSSPRPWGCSIVAGGNLADATPIMTTIGPITSPATTPSTSSSAAATAGRRGRHRLGYHELDLRVGCLLHLLRHAVRAEVLRASVPRDWTTAGFAMTVSGKVSDAAFSLSEAQLCDAVIELARTLSWKVTHFRPAMVRGGWRTPIQGDAGFPDLVLARGNRVVFVELKSMRGRLSHHQVEWIGALVRSGAEVFLWTPEDWFSGRIEKSLRSAVREAPLPLEVA